MKTKVFFLFIINYTPVEIDGEFLRFTCFYLVYLTR